jgi:hypothetical protein
LKVDLDYDMWRLQQRINQHGELVSTRSLSKSYGTDKDQGSGCSTKQYDAKNDNNQHRRLSS